MYVAICPFKEIVWLQNIKTLFSGIFISYFVCLYYFSHPPPMKINGYLPFKRRPVVLRYPHFFLGNLWKLENQLNSHSPFVRLTALRGFSQIWVYLAALKGTRMKLLLSRRVNIFSFIPQKTSRATTVPRDKDFLHMNILDVLASLNKPILDSL